MLHRLLLRYFESLIVVLCPLVLLTEMRSKRIPGGESFEFTWCGLHEKYDLCRATPPPPPKGTDPGAKIRGW